MKPETCFKVSPDGKKIAWLGKKNEKTTLFVKAVNKKTKAAPNSNRHYKRIKACSIQMKYLLAFLFCIFFLASCAHQPKPVEGPNKPFKSDGCSCWPDKNYSECCQEHDKTYWAGGSPAERKKADLTLKECTEKKGFKNTAVLMYWGSRIFGHGWIPTPFRWGFGYHWPEGYFQGTPKNNDRKTSKPTS